MPTDEILKEGDSGRAAALASIGDGLGPPVGGVRDVCGVRGVRARGVPAGGTRSEQLNRSLLSPGLGTSRSGFHSGWGWDSHGSVTCHSYGCGVNYATGTSVAEMVNAKA